MLWMLLAGFSGFVNPAHGQLAYIPNKGQWAKEVEYRAQLSYGRFYLQKGGFTYTFLAPEQLKRMHHRKALSGAIDAHALKIRFKGANPNPDLKDAHPLKTKYNFYLGSNPKRWQSGLSAYQKVKYQDLYDGIDLDVISQGNRIKYNFQVAVGSNPNLVSIAYKGADSLYLDEQGNLVVSTSVNQFKEKAPEAYQVINGERKAVPCEYILENKHLRFHFPEGYNDRYPLTIDPEVVFSTFSGSIADNFGYSATFDSFGRGYSAGTVFGSDFPDTSGPGGFQVKWAGGTNTDWGGGSRDVGILKYNDSGTALKYATFLGGSGNEDPHSMVVNSEQDLLVFGNTGSANFPTTAKAYDTTYNGNYDIYVSKISEDGSTLKSSTYVGGSKMDGLNGQQEFTTNPLNFFNSSNLGWNYGDMFRGEVIVDGQDRVLVATTTKSGQSFPATNGSFQTQYGGGDQDGCLLRLDAKLQQLEAASFIGGGLDDAVHSVTIAPDQSLLVAGGTVSNQLNFPVNGYQQQNNGGEADAIVLRISQDFSKVKAATFLGTSEYDQAYFVQTTPAGEVYITGQTTSNQFPTKNARYSVDSGKQFVTKLSKQLDKIRLSATFGSGDQSSPDLSPSAFLVDTCGKIYFSGWGGGASDEINYDGGNTKGLPVTKGAFDTTTDGSDFYVTVFAENMSKLLYATFYGGSKSSEHVDGGTSRFDESGIIYQSICAGCGGFSDLPTTKDAYSRVNRGTRPFGGQTGCNNALLKIDLNLTNLLAGFSASGPVCIADSVSFTKEARLADSIVWYFGDGDTSHRANPTHTYNQAGTYKVTQIAFNDFSCDIADTAEKTVTVYEKIQGAIQADTGACVNVREFKYTGDFGQNFRWLFGDGTTAKGDSIVQHTYKDTGDFVVSCMVDAGSACADTVKDTVSIKELVQARFQTSVDSCSGTVTFQNQSTNALNFQWVFEGQSQSKTGLGAVKHQYETSDTFHPRLIAAPDKVCADTLTDTLALSNILSNFTYTITDPCQFRVRLRNSKALTDTVIWQLPDTTIQAVDSAKVSLPGGGRYPVAMWIKGAPNFCRDTSRRTIALDTLPKIDFTAIHPTCQPYLTINPDSINAERISWRLTGANSANDTVYQALQARKRLPLPATQPYYQVTAIADPSAQCPDTVSRKVAVDSLAEAAFSLTLDTCNQRLRAVNKSPKGLAYRWEFGDGSGSRAANPVHKYQQPGNFRVTLFASDGLCRDTVTKLFEVLPTPKATYSYQRDTCSPTVKFSSQSNPDHPHLWRFDNGDTSNLVNPTETYKEPGKRKVSLVVGPDDRCADTTQKLVDIPDFVEGQITVASNQCRPQLTLQASTNRADSLAWEGAIAPYLSNPSNDSVVVDLPEAGVYKVKLIAFSKLCQDTATREVVANPSIEAGFTFNQVPCRPEFRFESKEKQATDHLWKWGDGSLESGPPELNHTYESGGAYEVTYVANSKGPCADTATKTIRLSKDVFLPLEIPNVFTPNGDGVNDRFAIQGIEDCKSYTLFIYNRWGQLVHKTSGKALSWSGKDQETTNALPSGTYFYKLKGPKFLKTGTITLIRDD